MKKEVIKRVEDISEYIIKTKDTIRETAKKFEVSKSTVHKDIKERLKQLDINKYNQIMLIFDEHVKVRHILGGQSTKMKYQRIKFNSEG